MTVPLPEHLPRRAVLGRMCRRRDELPAPRLAQGSDRAVRDALIGTLADLAPGRRHVLVLAAMGGLGPAAIANVMGLSVDVVGTLLQDAVDQVVSRLVA